VGQRLTNRRHQIVIVPRLADKAFDADLIDRPQQRVEIGVAGKNQPRRIGLQRLGALEKLDAIHFRHAEIADEQVKRFVAGALQCKQQAS
jgi:hypothetical protein